MKNWNLSNGYTIRQVLTGRSNSYLISTGKDILLVDTGRKSRRTRLTLQLLHHSKEGADWLILTHVHFDHCENASYIQEKFQSKIITSRKSEELCRKGRTRIPSGTNKWLKMITDFINKLPVNISRYQAFSPDFTVKKEFSFPKTDFAIQLIATPGHSADSISIIVNNEIALVGDVLFGVFPNRVLPPFADDKEELIKSWGKLLETGCHTFLPGHGKAIKRSLLEREYQKYLQQ